MLGWEFPPFISGGLGTACFGLTKAMSQLGIQITFVLPKPVQSEYSTHVKLVSPKRPTPMDIYKDIYITKELETVKFKRVPVNLQPYIRPEEYETEITEVSKEIQSRTEYIGKVKEKQSQPHQDNWSFVGGGDHYAGDLFTEVEKYAKLGMEIALTEEFDIIHAHDWMTYPAGIAISKLTGKPLVIHVHSTEFDRSGENVNQRIYDIEYSGMQSADRIITVSFYTKQIVMNKYNVLEEKIRVVYNAIDINGRRPPKNREILDIKKGEKIVLFLGRITMQKGPEYFLSAAKKVLEVMDNVRFIMAGSGDMMKRMIELSAEMGIGHKVLFTGFLRGKDVERVYRMADLYVMPSVSEPFGIAPLEAISHDVPVIVSKQSGVSEILTHILKVDFWDINEMANKIIAVLKYRPLHSTLREHSGFEVRRLSWTDSAKKCVDVYNEVLTPTYANAF